MCLYCKLQYALRISLHKVTFLLYFSHGIQHRGISCSLALCSRLKMSLFTCSSSLSDYRIETGQNIYGQGSSTEVYQHKQAKPPITLKQIKHNRKKNCAKQCINTTIFFVALCKHTAFIVSKQSGCVFSLTGVKPPLPQCPLKEYCIKVSYRQHNNSKGTEQTPYTGRLVVHLINKNNFKHR